MSVPDAVTLSRNTPAERDEASRSRGGAVARSARLGPQGLEVVVAALAAAAFVAADIWLCDAAIVFTRPLWLDEIHTVLVAGRQDTLTSLRSLAAGADFNPPTLFLLFRAVGHLTGGLSEPVLRSVTAVSVVVTLPAVYWILRGQFARGPSAAGALSTWAQSVVVTEAFDARFYALWLFGAAALSLAVRAAIQGRPGWLNRIALGVASVFVCTIHYFGILSWLAVMLVATVWREPAERRRVTALLPALAGPIALTFCLPFYMGQRAALSMATWIPDVTIPGVLFLVGLALVTPPLVISLVSWTASRFLQRPSPDRGLRTAQRRFTLGPALLLGQALVPIALGFFSLVVQPTTQPRYSIAAALFAAPIVALAFARSTWLLRMATVLAIVATSASLVADEARSARQRARIVHQDLSQVSPVVARDSLVVVRRRHSLYPILLAQPEFARNVVLLDGASLAPNDRFVIVERDVARAHRRLYGIPGIVTPTDLRSTSAFYLLEADSTRRPTADEFPHRRIDKVGQRLFRLELDCGRGPAAAAIDHARGDC